MIPVPKFWCANTKCTIYLKRPNGNIKKLVSGKWWINRRTPVGEDAIIYEIKPYGGQREINYKEIVGIDEPNNG